MGEDGDVRAPFRLGQIGPGRRHPEAVLRGDLVKADALLIRAVEIGVAPKAGLFARLDKGFAERVHVAALARDVDRAIAAAILVGAGLIGLQTLEDGQDVVPAPARVSERLPVVEVFVLAADEDHGVDRA